jgi:tRNA U34 5-methylaminomethyl-2-thiouridine-forming methyltransferase MnmC
MYREELRDKKELIVTEDGTKTLFSSEFNEAYHSTKDGALVESLEKHVKPAFLLQKDKKDLVILDICFGLGYNTLATLYYIKKHNLSTKVDIISPEIDRGLIDSLKDFDYPKEFNQFREIIEELSKNLFYKDNQFRIEILIGDAREIIPKIDKKIDIVYQDAFSPKQNPLLWTKEYFRDIKALSRDNTIITTYSVASSVRMGLYENGYNIFLIEGRDVRPSTIASPKILDLKYIDMELKKARNPNARSFRDSDFI